MSPRGGVRYRPDPHPARVAPVPRLTLATSGAAGVPRSHAPHGVRRGGQVSVDADAGELAAWSELDGSPAGGLFALSVRDGLAVVTRDEAKDADADVPVAVAALGSLYRGGVGVHTLTRSGRVTSRAASTRSALCSATAGSPTASPLSRARALAPQP